MPTEWHVERQTQGGGGNVPGEAGEYAKASAGATAVEEQAPKKIRERCLMDRRPVPETDTGGRVEDTEALERLTVKELGKLAP